MKSYSRIGPVEWKEEKTVKKWYQSKTVKANIVMAIGVGLQIAAGHNIISPQIQAEIILIVNLALRFISKDEIKL